MKIEVLFPEVANLYGDNFNIKYLEKCLNKSKIINTSLTEEPAFVKEDIKMIYMGPMTETNQKIVIEKLRPYQKRIKELIKKGVIFLITGNALEVFGDYIIDGKDKIKALGIFNTYAVYDYQNRHNSLFLGEYQDLKIVGYKSQFSQSYNNQNPFIKTIRGTGFNHEDSNEGIHYHNFFGTYLLGPILILNPYFTKEILKLLDNKAKLVFEEESLLAYQTRLKEYQNEKLKF